MPRALLAYASTHGHAAKVALRIAETLRGQGVHVHTHDLASAGELTPSAYDLVIVGASVHAGRHQPEAVDWANRHAIALGAMPSALFSISLAAADETDEARKATRDYLDDFEDDTGWTPGLRASFAGALQYREYDFVTRLVMRLVMAHGHHPTDISRDYDYTDWDAVDRFAHRCAAMVTSAPE